MVAERDETRLRCTGTTGKRAEPCDVDPTYVDRAGRLWCHVHADRSGCLLPPREALASVVAYRRALRPAGGKASREDLLALGRWAKPRIGSLREWAELTRRLLAESPLRDLASAAIEARLEVEAAVDSRKGDSRAVAGSQRHGGGLDGRGGVGGSVGRSGAREMTR